MSAAKATNAEVRLYDHLFATEKPDAAPEGGSFLDNLKSKLARDHYQPSLSRRSSKRPLAIGFSLSAWGTFLWTRSIRRRARRYSIAP